MFCNIDVFNLLHVNDKNLYFLLYNYKINVLRSIQFFLLLFPHLFVCLYLY